MRAFVRVGVGGAAGGRNAWVPREPAGMKEGRENSLLSNADRVPPGTLPGSHPPGGVGITVSNNNDHLLSARCMPGAVLSALPA